MRSKCLRAICLAVALLGMVAAAEAQTSLVAYVQEGDLWVRRGVEPPQRLTTRQAVAFPRISPDGAQLAFLNNGALCVMPVANPAPITLLPLDTANFVWSPKSDILVAWDRTGLYVYRQKDSWRKEGIWGAHPAPVLVTDAIVSANGEYLVAATRTRRGGQDTGALEVIPLQRYFEYDIASEAGNGFALYGQGHNDAVLFWKVPSFSASFAADGLNLYAVPVPGAKPRPLGNLRTLVYRDMLSLSPDGESLAATLVTSGGRETWEDRPLAITELATGKHRIVSPPHVSTLSPAWAPAGDWIAYEQAPVGDNEHRRMNERKIWIVRPDGTEAHALTRDQSYRDERPLWISSDTILFCRIDAAFHASLWSISVSGANATRIADLPTLPDEAFGYYGHIDWGQYLDVWTSRQ